MAMGATYSVFSTGVEYDNATFATGTCELQINGQEAIEGVQLLDACPGDFVRDNFDITNSGTVNIEQIRISADMIGDTSDADLYDLLGCLVQVSTDSGATWKTVYNGLLTELDGADVLAKTHLNELPAGWSVSMRYKVSLPNEVGNEGQGKTANYAFYIDGYCGAQEQ
jgi:hypothetical protein